VTHEARPCRDQAESSLSVHIEEAQEIPELVRSTGLNRCPSLRLNPSARPRLVEIIANLRDRIQEAQLNGWLGEVAGLQASLNEAARKLTSLDRARGQAGTVDLGVPVIIDSPG
jgi:hypothetical protein